MSALVGYKLTPRLQAIARADDIDNRANGGGGFQSCRRQSDYRVWSRVRRDRCGLRWWSHSDVVRQI